MAVYILDRKSKTCQQELEVKTGASGGCVAAKVQIGLPGPFLGLRLSHDSLR